MFITSEQSKLLSSNFHRSKEDSFLYRLVSMKVETGEKTNKISSESSPGGSIA
jgi:hypothetical protein